LAATSNLPPGERLDPRASNRSRRHIRVPLPARSRRKLAGRSAIVALVLLSAITGSLAGLTLV